MRPLSIVAALAAIAIVVFVPASARADPPAVIISIPYLDPFENDPSGGFDPAQAFTVEAWQLSYATCANLFNFPDAPAPLGGQAKPDAAAGSPTISADGLTYTFTIRSGLSFSPPSTAEVTPQSFIRAIERLAQVGDTQGLALYGSNIAGFAEYMSGTASSISGLSASGSQLTIQLLQPDGSLLAKLAMPAFCAVPADTPLTTVALGDVLPGAGPYYVDPSSIVTTGSDLASFTVLRNPNYGGTRTALLPEFDYLVESDRSNAISEAEAGTVDVVTSLSSSLAAGVRSAYGAGSTADLSGEQELFETLQNGTAFLSMNTTRVPLAVRKAIALGIDRSTLAALLGFVADDRFLPPTTPSSSVYSSSADVTSARAQMASAGYDASHHYGPVVLVGNGGSYSTIGNEVVSELAAIYVDATLDITHSNPSYYSWVAANGASYDLAFGTWVTDFYDPGDLVEPVFGSAAIGSASAGMNQSRLSDAATDDALAYGTGLVDAGARATHYATLAERLARDSVPAAAFGHRVLRTFTSTRVGCQVSNVLYGFDLTRLCLRSSVSAGASYSSGVATASDPVGTTVQSPQAGSVAVSTGAVAADATGYEIVGTQLSVEAPAASAATPLSLEFEVHQAELAAQGLTAQTVTILRNDEPVTDCTVSDGTATPDPCVSARTTDGFGNAHLTVLSSHASEWNVAATDQTAPARPSVVLSPASYAPGTSTRVSASGDSDAVAAEMYLDMDAGAGANLPLDGGAGSFSSPSFGSTLTVGTHTIGVRVRDRAHNWSTVRTIALTVAASSSGGAPGGGGSSGGSSGSGGSPGSSDSTGSSVVDVVRDASHVEATIVVGSTGSLDLPTSGTSLRWPAGAFGSNTKVAATVAGPSAVRGFSVGTVAVSLTFTGDGGAMHTFAAPLELVFADPPAGFAPAYSEDGLTWHGIAHIPAPDLPAGAAEGWYRGSDGAVHVLTRHATFFGLLGALQLAVWTRPVVHGRSVTVYIAAGREGSATLALADRHSGKVVARARTVVARRSRAVHLRLPSSKPGVYAITVRAAAGPSSAVKVMRLRVARR